MTRAREKPNPPQPPEPKVYHQRIQVSFDYPVYFARDVFVAGNPLLASAIDRLHEGRRQRAMVAVDAGLASAQPQLLGRIKEYFHARPQALELSAGPALVPGGEAAKNDWQNVRDIMWSAGNAHLDRQSVVIAVGGGAVLDMVGFAASIVHRGLRVLRVPSTTLAQADAGVGVKTGMDEHGQKNFVGTFAPPFAVVNDFALLATLPQRDWIGGVAEAFKVALIKDAAFFEFLCVRAGALRARDSAAMEESIRRCAVLHLEHIASGGDPFETGSARPLDFGHWSAHKIETLSGYAVGHGQAAAIGVALDSCYAARTGLLSEADLDRILEALTACGLPIWHETIARRTADGRLAILDGLEEFREHLGGTLTITLPDGIGRKLQVRHMNPDLIDQAAAWLGNRNSLTTKDTKSTKKS